MSLKAGKPRRELDAPRLLPMGSLKSGPQKRLRGGSIGKTRVWYPQFVAIW